MQYSVLIAMCHLYGTVGVEVLRRTHHFPPVFDHAVGGQDVHLLTGPVHVAVVTWHQALHLPAGQHTRSSQFERAIYLTKEAGESLFNGRTGPFSSLAVQTYPSSSSSVLTLYHLELYTGSFPLPPQPAGNQEMPSPTKVFYWFYCELPSITIIFYQFYLELPITTTVSHWLYWEPPSTTTVCYWLSRELPSTNPICCWWTLVILGATQYNHSLLLVIQGTSQYKPDLLLVDTRSSLVQPRSTTGSTGRCPVQPKSATGYTSSHLVQPICYWQTLRAAQCNQGLLLVIL